MNAFIRRFRVLVWLAVGLTFQSCPKVFAVAGQLWTFGQNHDGQLADSTTTSRSIPAQVLTGIKCMAAGGSSTEGSQSFSIKTDGTLWGAGFNGYGQLGDGTTTSRVTPIQVASGVSAVSAGINHSLYLKTDGTVWAMGLNQYGQLGDGTTTNRSTPVQIATGVSAISAGGNHSLFLKTDGTLWATGYNIFGQLGDGNKPTNRSTPAQIATGVSAISAGGSHSLFLKTDNTLWVTGWNASGQLGVGPGSSYLSTPVQLTTGVSAIAAGNQHSLFLKTDGSLWAMGQNLFGQLGDGTMPTNQKIPVQVATQVSAVAAGASHSLWLKTDGTLWAMGLNTSGQLGDGTTNNRSLPVQVTDEVLSAAGGAESSYFIKAPGLLTQLDSWTALASGPTNHFQSLIFEDGRFVAGAAGVAPVGSGGLSMISGDGLSWTSSSAGALTNVDLAGITFGNGTYVAVGGIEVGSGGAIMLSSDGISWAGATSASQALKGITFGNGQFVAVGDNGLIQTSSDGSSWTVRASGTVNGLKGVAYGSGQFVAVGSAGTILTSTNAVTWTARTAGASASSNNLRGVVYGGGQYVAVGNGIVTSSDGATWTQRIAALADGTNYHAVTYRLGQYVTAGVTSAAQGAVLASPDAVTWTAHNPGAVGTLRGIGYGSNRFVLVGENGVVLTSAPAGSAPSITLNPVSQSVYAGNPVAFSVSADGAPPFTYQWRKNNVAISGATNSTYSITAADTSDAGSLVAIVTNSSGSATSTAATLTVLKADQTITFAAPSTHYYGEAPFTLSAVAAPSGLPVSFSVVRGPVTLSGSTLTITGVGSVTLRASQAGNLSYYAAPTVDRDFSVGKGTPAITWSAPSTVTYGTALSTAQLNATANLAGSFTYSPALGAVLDSGTQTLTATFTPTDTINYNSVTVQQTIVVSKVVASVTLGGLGVTYDGTTHAVTATTSAGTLNVDFTYNGSASVPIGAGSYAVVGTINSANYTGSASGTLIISKANQTIIFGALVDRHFGDSSFALSATVSPTGSAPTFSVVSGPATVAGNVGTLTGVGLVTLRASQLGDANYNAAPEVDRAFFALSPSPVVTWGAPSGITYGTLLSASQLNATANVPGTFVYSPAMGTLLNAGTYSMTVTFTPTDTANYSGATAQQTLVVSKATPSLTWSAPSAITYGTPLDSTQLNAAAGTLAGTFTYSPASGAVVGVGTTALTATFTPTDLTNYTSASTQQSIIVGKGTALVTLSGLSVPYNGSARSATATTSAGALNVEFTYNGASAAPVNPGTYAVVATINDANYNGAVSGSFTIVRADQVINFSAISDRTIGDLPFGLTATATPSALPITFTVVSGPATVAGNIVTVSAIGTITIRASQAGNQNYNPATLVTRIFEVMPAGGAPSPGIRNADGSADTIWRNPTPGQRNIWLMNGTQFRTDVGLGTVDPAWRMVAAADFNGDGQNDILWQNRVTGQRRIWLMNKTVFSSSVDLGTFDINWQFAAAADFNGDGQIDILWQNKVTGQRSVWLMKGTTFIAGVDLGTYDINWQMVAAADFNGDGRTDILWQNKVSGQRSIWLMNGTTLSAGVDLGIHDVNWQMVAAADFDGDGQNDILWQNRVTGQRSVWLMSGTVFTTGVDLGIQNPLWQVAAVADFNGDGSPDILWQANAPTSEFNGDGRPDIIWQNAVTGEGRIWLMNAFTASDSVSLGIMPLAWQVAGSADFNGDLQSDILWRNKLTGESKIWLMNGAAFSSSVDLGTADPNWQIVAAADFSGDRQSDILWQNKVTGARRIWLMSGTTFSSSVDLGSYDIQWEMVAAADFNDDGQSDILWQNRVTGQRSIWLMNGTVISASTDLGTYDINWQMVAAADYNGDGQGDILWENIVTGQRSIWLMNGTTIGSGVDLGTYELNWQIRN